MGPLQNPKLMWMKDDERVGHVDLWNFMLILHQLILGAAAQSVKSWLYYPT